MSYPAESPELQELENELNNPFFRLLNALHLFFKRFRLFAGGG